MRFLCAMHVSAKFHLMCVVFLANRRKQWRMEGEEYRPSFSSVSSSLEEPLLELANMNTSPQPKLIAKYKANLK